RLIAIYPRAPFRILRNEPKLHFDENVYRVYQEARGTFLWFCSDRFFYNVDIGLILGLIARHPALRAITFSDLFRRVHPPAKDRQNDLDLLQDYAILEKLSGEFLHHQAHRYFLTSVDQVVDSDSIYGGAAALFDATPDCIVRINHSS